MQVVRSAPPGLYLDAGELGEVLLPNRYRPEQVVDGDTIDVFLFRDSEDRLTATTEEPYAWAGEFALFEVVGVVAGVGAFLDWGLPKDLFLPLREQAQRVQEGNWIVAFVMVDPKSHRMIASTRLSHFIDQKDHEYYEGQPVRFLVSEQTDLGYKCIVDHSYSGLLYSKDLHIDLEIGEFIDGYIRAIREDRKIDLSLDPSGYERIGPIALQVLDKLKAAGGRLEFNDKSSPAEIRVHFATSKKAFKQALGTLLKDKRIRFSKGGIELAEE